MQPITTVLWNHCLGLRSEKHSLSFECYKSILKVELKNAKGFPSMHFSMRPINVLTIRQLLIYKNLLVLFFLNLTKFILDLVTHCSKIGIATTLSNRLFTNTNSCYLPQLLYCIVLSSNPSQGINFRPCK